MKCTACGQEIPTASTGFAVCPYCGTVNVPSQPEPKVIVQSFDTAVITDPINGSVLQNKRKWLPFSNKAAVIVLVILVVLIGGSCSAYVLHASPKKPATGNFATAKAKSVNTKPTVPTTPAPQTPTPTPVPTPVSNPVAAKPQTQVAPKQQVAPITLADVLNSINQVLASYGVTATLNPSGISGLTWGTLDDSDVSTFQQFKPYLTEEFSKYPKDLVVNSGLRTIALVKNLQVSGQARVAAPAPLNTSMVYDVDLMANSGSAYAREVVSHEYWHYLDYKSQGSYTYADAGWQACNPSGFSYGSGGASAYGNSGYTAAFHPSPAFITTYSTYAMEEDKAEMFGWLMYSPSSVKALGDSGINCKINRLTTLVHILSPSMSF